MQLEVRTPEVNLFTGEVKGVKLPGTAGQFEVLDDHAPMIASLDEGDMRITTDKGQKHYTIAGGLIEVMRDKVVVIIEGGEEKK
jgi:F-type H+-transporting ATPase subunit epsilon